MGPYKVNKELAVIDYSIKFYKNYCSSSALGFQKYRDLIHSAGFTGCLVNDKVKSVFMHIDKCASRSLTAMLKTIGFVLINDQKDFVLRDDYKIFAVVRDPVSRWPAGLNEYMYRYLGPECEENNPMYEKTVPDEMRLSLEQIEQQVRDHKLIFEEHTAPQHLFLTPCKDRKIHHIRMDHRLEEKIKKLLGIDIELPHYNVSADKRPNYKKFCNDLFEKYVKDSVEFHTVYKKDFEIFKNSE